MEIQQKTNQQHSITFEKIIKQKRYLIQLECNEIIFSITFYFRNQPEGKRSFTKEQMCSLSKYFIIYNSIEDIYLFCSQKHFKITHNYTCFNIEIPIKVKHYDKITLPIPFIEDTTKSDYSNLFSWLDTNLKQIEDCISIKKECDYLLFSILSNNELNIVEKWTKSNRWNFCLLYNPYRF